MPDRLKAAWLNYQTQALSRDAPLSQVRECRRAFYVGASALLGIMLSEVGDDPEGPTTPAELRLMEELQAELERFAREIRAGKA